MPTQVQGSGRCWRGGSRTATQPNHLHRCQTSTRAPSLQACPNLSLAQTRIMCAHGAHRGYCHMGCVCATLARTSV
eukprot:4173083-Lingulodinium_polyedra.AAC.1